MFKGGEFKGSFGINSSMSEIEVFRKDVSACTGLVWLGPGAEISVGSMVDCGGMSDASALLLVLLLVNEIVASNFAMVLFISSKSFLTFRTVT